MLTNIKADQNKHRDTPQSWNETLNVVKKAILCKCTYFFIAISFLSKEIDKLSIKLTWKCKGANSENNFCKRRTIVEDIPYSILKFTIMLQKPRQGGIIKRFNMNHWKWEFTSKSLHLFSNNFWQTCHDNSMNERKFLQQLVIYIYMYTCAYRHVHIHMQAHIWIYVNRNI